MSDTNMNVDQVCKELNMKPVTVKRYAREGLLTGKQVNGDWTFLQSDITKFKEIQAKLGR